MRSGRDRPMKGNCIALMLFTFSSHCLADISPDSANNMCADFAKNKPPAQREAFKAQCVSSMLNPQSTVVFPGSEPINIPQVMADGKAWFLKNYVMGHDGTFRGERLVKYTSYVPGMSRTEAVAQGLKEIPAVPYKQSLLYCGEFSTDGSKFRWFIVEAKTETVGRKGLPVEFVPPPPKRLPNDAERGICISGVKLN